MLFMHEAKLPAILAQKEVGGNAGEEIEEIEEVEEEGGWASGELQ
jgi:hypothetical protein